MNRAKLPTQPTQKGKEETTTNGIETKNRSE